MQRPQNNLPHPSVPGISKSHSKALTRRRRKSIHPPRRTLLPHAISIRPVFLSYKATTSPITIELNNQPSTSLVKVLLVVTGRTKAPWASVFVLVHIILLARLWVL